MVSFHLCLGTQHTKYQCIYIYIYLYVCILRVCVYASSYVLCKTIWRLVSAHLKLFTQLIPRSLNLILFWAFGSGTFRFRFRFSDQINILRVQLLSFFCMYVYIVAHIKRCDDGCEKAFNCLFFFCFLFCCLTLLKTSIFFSIILLFFTLFFKLFSSSFWWQIT